MKEKILIVSGEPISVNPRSFIRVGKKLIQN